MSINSPLIEITDLTFTHIGRSSPTIASVNLTLYPGEIVLIAGATGSGKSTLLNCIAKIAPAHTGGQITGNILYQGNSILDQSVRQRSQILGIILQNVETQLFTDRVQEELAFGLENLNTPPDRIAALTDNALQQFGLEEQRSKAIAQLSAGQKQRLVLACVLAMNQPILLLDEPFAYLDRQGAELLLQLLQARTRQGQSVLLVEHRLDLVGKSCDRHYHFEQGKLSSGRLEDMGNLGTRKQEDTGTRGHGDIETQENFHSPRRRVSLSPRLLPSPLHSTPYTLVLHTHKLSWGGYSPFPDLEVQAGETVLLQGDNGCGKTTLLKLLCGLLKPATGRVEILGRDTRRRSVVQIAQTVGFVLQNPNHQLFAETVRQEILQPGVKLEDADRMLVQLSLSDRASEHPQSLSQGQKRRLALGAVLARKPKICLLDEITVGQDPQSLGLMLATLREFTRQGGSLILTSHDQHIGDDLEARLVLM